GVRCRQGTGHPPRNQNACRTNNVKAGCGPGMAREATGASAVAEVMALFDLVVESSVEGVRKPEPRAYELVLERLGVDAESVLYLDDLGINLKPAAAMGMTTITVVSEAQALEHLARHTGLAL
ncbi:MAG: HAD-IA family hydrolase, partial [Pseudomonadales bacterium]